MSRKSIVSLMTMFLSLFALIVSICALVNAQKAVTITAMNSAMDTIGEAQRLNQLTGGTEETMQELDQLTLQVLDAAEIYGQGNVSIFFTVKWHKMHQAEDMAQEATWKALNIMEIMLGGTTE